ncbi:MAG: hypothetical protein E6I69_12190 [Chloroflexi bacterium]|nr:MAG: hypothetical protein DMC62_08680 [Verrucomicrobiota bacterium]TME02958.1 MAG: hypothetical protein E6I69_12190 [Chloroflexota bacterium]
MHTPIIAAGLATVIGLSASIVRLMSSEWHLSGGLSRAALVVSALAMLLVIGVILKGSAYDWAVASLAFVAYLSTVIPFIVAGLVMLSPSVRDRLRGRLGESAFAALVMLLSLSVSFLIWRFVAASV